MQSDDERIGFDIGYALSLTALRPRRRDARDSDLDRALAAQKILDHLKLCGWRFWKRPASRAHTAGGDG